MCIVLFTITYDCKDCRKLIKLHQLMNNFTNNVSSVGLIQREEVNRKIPMQQRPHTANFPIDTHRKQEKNFTVTKLDMKPKRNPKGITQHSIKDENNLGYDSQSFSKIKTPSISI